MSRNCCQTRTNHDRENPSEDLLSPLKIREITFKNRIGMSPMCQYSCEEGLANDWHLVHLGSRAVGGSGLVMVEATAVEKEGRISPGDMGLWEERHQGPLARIASFLKSQGAVTGIQLAHAGRKGNCKEPWKRTDNRPAEEGWQLSAPSPIPFDADSQRPIELDLASIDRLVHSFSQAAERAVQAGFQVIEIHAAHGYLLHEFLSPLSNQRKDVYGGSLENRCRLVLEVADSLRKIVPDDRLLFVRISATDWIEGGWDIDQSVFLAKQLKKAGVDLIDVSSGGISPQAAIPIAKNYQVPFARQIREEAGIKTATVGLITEIDQANEVITTGQADLVLLGREFLREPYWALKAEQHLGSNPKWPLQYGYAVQRKPK